VRGGKGDVRPVVAVGGITVKGGGVGVVEKGGPWRGCQQLFFIVIKSLGVKKRGPKQKARNGGGFVDSRGGEQTGFAPTYSIEGGKEGERETAGGTFRLDCRGRGEEGGEKICGGVNLFMDTI